MVAAHSQRSNQLHRADQLELSQARSRWAPSPHSREHHGKGGKTEGEEQANMLRKRKHSNTRNKVCFEYDRVNNHLRLLGYVQKVVVP